MKKHDIFKILGIVILVYAVLTWIFDASYYSGFLQVVDKEEFGLGFLLNVPLQTLGYFSYLFIFILAVGAFYGILEATGLYRKTLDTVAKKLKGHKKLTLIVITVLMALISSFTGIELGMLFVFPFVISLIVLLGYDKYIAMAATVGATLVGMLGSTYSYNSYGIVNDILGTTYSDGIIVKLILLVVGILLLVGFMLLHIKNAKKGSKEMLDMVPEKVEQRKGVTKHIWPILVVMGVAFVILLIGTFNWNNVFEITLFDDILDKITGTVVFGYPLFDNLLSGAVAFGTWNGPSKFIYYTETLLVLSIVLAIVYKIGFNTYLDEVAKGAKKNLKAAVLTILCYVVLVVVSSFPVFLTITQKITGETFNVATTGLLNLVGSALYVDIYYYPQYVLEYFASFKDVNANVLSVLFVSIYSLAMLVAPTSVLLVTTLQNTDTKYVDWIKFIWKLFLALLLVVFVVLVVYFLV